MKVLLGNHLHVDYRDPQNVTIKETPASERHAIARDLSRDFVGRTYWLGRVQVLVIGVDDERRKVRLAIGDGLVWVDADLLRFAVTVD